MPYIQFTALGDLLAFVSACHLRQEALGQQRNREKYSRIHFDPGASYSIRFASEDWNPAQPPGQFLYGGTIETGGRPGGHELHLNDLLERLPLLAGAMPPNPHALVLAVEQAGKARPFEVLHEAWRTVPKLDGAESRFFVRRSERAEAWAAVEIREVSPQFDFESLARARQRGLVVFAPAWNEPNCFLYVEWGFGYAKPEEFATLYDDQARAREEGGARRAALLLVRAGPRSDDVRGGPRGAVHAARWQEVALESHSLTEDLYKFKMPAEVVLSEISGTEIADQDKLQTCLEAGEFRQFVGTAEEIERRLARCSREQEELLTQKARLAARRETAWLPAYTFDQRVGEPLPARLQLFLRRPLGELAQYRYVALGVPAGRRHCVIGEVAMPWGAAMAVPSETTWLCDARWREWGLPLFLRSDCALSVPVDEENMAAKVRDFLADKIAGLDLSGADAAILTEPASAEGGLAFCPLAPVQTLDELLGFFNETIACAEVFAESVAPAGEALVRESDAQAAAAIVDLDATLQQRAAELLGELEREWDGVRNRAMAALLQLRVTEAAVQIGGQACVESCEGWAQFVNRVLDLDERISRVKVAAVANWFADQASRKARLEAVELAQRNYAGALAKSKELLDAERRRLDAEREQLETALRELEAMRAECTKEAAAVGAQSQALDARNRQAEAELRDAQAVLKKLEQEIARQGRLLAESEKCATETQARQTRVEELAGEINAAGEVETESVEQLRRTARECLVYADQTLPPPEPPPTFFGRLRRWFGGGKKEER